MPVVRLADNPMCFSCGGRNAAGVVVAEAKGRFVQISR